MQCHRIEELLELLQPLWISQQELSLVQLLQQLQAELKLAQLEDLTDDMLIYHLKMRGKAQDALIPGLAKDHVVDFKAALLAARRNPS